MIFYGVLEQKQFLEIYKEFPIKEYCIELMNKSIENQNKENPLENKVSLN